MEEEAKTKQTKESNTQVYYIIGAVVLVAVIAAGFFLRPNMGGTATPGAATPTAGTQQQATTETATTPTAAKGPITQLGCDTQFYNPVVGVPGTYYLSLDGAVPSNATSVDCTFTATVGTKVEATQTVSATPVPNAERGGSVFRCSTQGLKLTPNVATKVTVDLRDSNNVGATCSRFFSLP